MTVLSLAQDVRQNYIELSGIPEKFVDRAIQSIVVQIAIEVSLHYVAPMISIYNIVHEVLLVLFLFLFFQATTLE